MLLSCQSKRQNTCLQFLKSRCTALPGQLGPTRHAGWVTKPSRFATMTCCDFCNRSRLLDIENDLLSKLFLFRDTSSTVSPWGGVDVSALLPRVVPMVSFHNAASIPTGNVDASKKFPGAENFDFYFVMITTMHHSYKWCWVVPLNTDYQSPPPCDTVWLSIKPHWPKLSHIILPGKPKTSGPVNQQKPERNLQSIAEERVSL